MLYYKSYILFTNKTTTSLPTSKRNGNQLSSLFCFQEEPIYDEPPCSEDFLDSSHPIPVPQEDEGDYEDIDAPPPTAHGQWSNKGVDFNTKA